MEQTKKDRTITVLFILSIVTFFITDMIDGESLWFIMLHNVGLVRWRNFFESILGIVFAAFPLLAIVFTKNKVVSTAFSTANLVLAIFFIIAMSDSAWQINIGWLMY